MKKYFRKADFAVIFSYFGTCGAPCGKKIFEIVVAINVLV